MKMTESLMRSMILHENLLQKIVNIQVSQKSKKNPKVIHWSIIFHFFLVTLDNIHQEIWQKYLKMTTIVKENS